MRVSVGPSEVVRFPSKPRKQVHPLPSPLPEDVVAAYLLEAHVSSQLSHHLLMLRVDGRVLQHHSNAADARIQHSLQDRHQGERRGHTSRVLRILPRIHKVTKHQSNR